MRQRNVCFACGGRSSTWFHRGDFLYVRCDVCGAVCTDPIPSERVIRRHYESKFANGNYLLLREYAPEYRRIYQQFIDVLTSVHNGMQQSLRAKSILDIGCFTGEFLALAKKQGMRVYGTELQEDAVRIARRKIGKNIIEADIGTKKFPHKTFDVISLLGLIEHVTNPDGLISNVYAHLKPEGVLLIQTPDAGSMLAHILGRWWPPLAPVEHIHLFSADGLVRFLSRAGFTDIRVYPHIKLLPVAYVYKQLGNFGPHFQQLISPLGFILTRLPHGLVFPFYGGEMIVTTRKRL